MNLALGGLEKIVEWLKLPEVKQAKDTDNPLLTELYRKIILQKKFLKRLYIDWYAEFKKKADKIPGGYFVELGSGEGFLKDIIPNVITSDILFLPYTDINFSVSEMPIKDKAINAFFMLNVLHHINNPRAFFNELNRCLGVEGKIIMIEPANTFFGHFIWKNFHSENFDPFSKDWGFEEKEPLAGANIALPWIIFFRDKDRFCKEFPMLQIKRIQFHTPLRYLISGGVSLRQLLPSFTYGLIKNLEYILSPLNKYISMFLTIEIEKEET